MRLSPRRSLKKVLAELSAPTRGGLPRASFGSAGSFSVDFKKDEKDVESYSNPATPAVRFDETANQYYEPQYAVESDWWYSGEDAAAFRKECAKLARLLTATEDVTTDSEAWSQILLRAYQGFCKADTADEVMKVFEDNKVHVNDTALGLDSWVIRQIHYDRVERRRRLISEIQALQYSGKDPKSLSSKMLKLSRVLSRPSRLYSHHTALLVANSVEEENA